MDVIKVYFVFVLGAALCVIGCSENEGEVPGGCGDGADNDGDGLFDCDDPDCTNSPDCDGDDDDVTDDDDDDVTDDDDDDVTDDDDDTVPQCDASFNVAEIDNQAMSMVFVSGSLWVMDWGNQRFLEINPNSGSVLSTDDGPTEDGEAGLTHDGSHFWSVAYPSGTIYEYGIGGNIYDSFASDGSYMHGITYDGTNLLVANGRNDSSWGIHKYSTNGSELSSCSLNWSPSDLQWINGYLWASSGSEGYQTSIYKLDSSCNVVDTLDVGRSAQGIAFDGDCLWLSEHSSTYIWSMNVP